MTLVNMRINGVRSVAVWCHLCHHQAVLSADPWPDHVPVPLARCGELMGPDERDSPPVIGRKSWRSRHNEKRKKDRLLPRSKAFLQANRFNVAHG